MAPGEKGKLFKDVEQASKYVQFRPTYGEDLFTAVFEYAEPCSTDLAVDLGCGVPFYRLAMFPPMHLRNCFLMMLAGSLEICVIANQDCSYHAAHVV